MASVECEGIQKQFGSTTVLHRVDLTIADGEYVVLLGASGCGKSTLLRCIAGLEHPSAGEIRIQGIRVNERPPKDRDIAMVFQGYALYPHLSVRENMAFSLRLKRETEAQIRKKVDDTAEGLGLTALLERKPGELSGGQRQRVAMGRAIVREPSVFLFDEPLSNLDASLRAHMRVELKRLHQRLGTTIIHVTHDQIEAMTLGNRLVLLHQGQVEQIGPPELIYSQPLTRYAAGFIGTPPMNFVDAVQESDGARVGDQLWPVHGKGRFILGIRPGELILGEGPATATVDMIEALGDETLVHLMVGTTRWIARELGVCTWQPGQIIRFSWKRAHGFDAHSGRRLEE